jgi:PKD repeat protein
MAIRRLVPTAFIAGVLLLALTPAARAVPSADFTMSWTEPPSRPSVGQTVTFTATVTDWDGLPGTVSWSFGEAGATATGETAEYAYAMPGLKFVTMTVTNGDTPAEPPAVVIKALNVNAPPTAAFSWSPLAPIAGQDVRFASESDDPDGAIQSYSWSFGDGVTSDQRNPEHPFATEGPKSVTLTVTDAWGATSSATHDVIVAALVPGPKPGPGNPPIARFAFGPRNPRVGDPVEFASSAVDPEGELRGTTWDLDGDGEFDDGRGEDVIYTYTKPGDKQVRMRVEDAAGLAAVSQRTVEVDRAPTPPPGFLRPPPRISFQGQIFPRGSNIRLLSVRAPRGALVTVRCTGKSCPAKQRRKRVKRNSVRFRSFERFLRAGVRVEIFVRKPNTIGDYRRYTIRAGKGPKDVQRCLMPGKSKPSRCPR